MCGGSGGFESAPRKTNSASARLRGFEADIFSSKRPPLVVMIISSIVHLITTSFVTATIIPSIIVVSILILVIATSKYLSFQCWYQG